MFCINCGKELPDISKFCAGCGASVYPGLENKEKLRPPVRQVKTAPAFPARAVYEEKNSGFIEKFGFKGITIVSVWIIYAALLVINIIIQIFFGVILNCFFIEEQTSETSIMLNVIPVILLSAVQIWALVEAIIITVKTAKNYMCVCGDRLYGNCSSCNGGNKRYCEIYYDNISKIGLKSGELIIVSADKNEFLFSLKEPERTAGVLKIALEKHNSRF